MNDQLRQYYEAHHASGRRLRQSLMEETRGKLFAAWIGTGQIVLDLGCRDGTLTRHFMAGNDITDADIDAAALQHAEATYGLSVRAVDLNAALPFDTQSFDVVVMAEVLEHLPYPSAVLQEVQRILKPHGRLIGSVPLAYHLKDRYRVLRGKKLTIAGDPTHVRFFSYDDIDELLAAYFDTEVIHILKGDPWAWFSRRWFARHIAFNCVKPARVSDTS